MGEVHAMRKPCHPAGGCVRQSRAPVWKPPQLTGIYKEYYTAKWHGRKFPCHAAFSFGAMTSKT
ncbi:hypothetical protein NSU_2738 [Novosphingobium pentaromativorans US6-1]|uniref:Uncharacterized protein n=1 Tax=Novosphingobium pentaromativorans US6-1 TaxID=1088721 RepID=G6EEG6_9SPHN|nr:hypothetical protein NSU_2738 [Novosphingobium pentaromativorans US6-1]